MAKDFRNVSEIYLSFTVVKLERQKKEKFKLFDPVDHSCFKSSSVQPQAVDC